MNLTGMIMRDNALKMKLTVIRLDKAHLPLKRQIVNSIVNGLMVEVSERHDHPDVIVVRREVAGQDIERVAKGIKFELKVLQGINNPELPFPVSL